jgi:gluconate:H+ symporter, GntP family
MSPIAELLLFLVGLIAGIILLISIFKIHPAITLALAGLVSGLVFGFPVSSIALSMASGFWKILTGIGVVIALGAILGTLMESSGALDVLVSSVVKFFGKTRPLTALSVLGLVVGIPVFCDSGFIILASTAKKIEGQQGLRHGLSSVALAGGLYTAHTLIPPTPGPVAAAGNLNMTDQLGLVIFSGFLVSIVLVLVLILISRWMAGKADNTDMSTQMDSSLPLRLLMPIVLALGLISVGSFIPFLDTNESFLRILRILTHPVMALAVACLLAWVQIPEIKKSYTLFRTGVYSALPIILITAMGGAFGEVLRESTMAEILEQAFADTGGSVGGLFIISYLVALILKTAQGSSTASIVITSSIMLPLLLAAELSPWHTALLISAIGSGSMAISHANDSFFWVVTKFSGMSVRQGYLRFSLTTLVLSISGLLTCLLLLFMSSDDFIIKQ